MSRDGSMFCHVGAFGSTTPAAGNRTARSNHFWHALLKRRRAAYFVYHGDAA